MVGFVCERHHEFVASGKMCIGHMCVFIFTVGDVCFYFCLLFSWVPVSMRFALLEFLSLFCGFIANVASTYTLICFVPEYSFTSCIFDSVVNNSNSPDRSFSFGGHVECVVDGS